MAGSLLTLYCNNPIQSNISGGLLTLTQPGASTSTTGWTVGKTSLSFPHSRMSYNAELANFNTTAQPNSSPITIGAHICQDTWRISGATTGDFSAGTWYSSASVIAVTAGGTQDGRMRYRIWRSSFDTCPASAATEITKGTMVGTTVTNLATTVAQSSSASTQVAAFSLNNEYVFLQCSWEITGVGGATGCDVLFRYGSLAQTNGSGLITSTFSTTGGGGGAVAKGTGYYNEYYRHIAGGVF
jgi:hypothetical protein